MRYWTSDLHFGHVNIIRYANRPFLDVDDMTEGLIERWNDVVTPNDEVWIVGDFAMGQIHETLPVAERLHGHKTLIPGNHDRCWSGASEKDRLHYDAAYDEMFDVRDGPLHTQLRDAQGTNAWDVTVHHFPRVEQGVAAERHGDAYKAHRPPYDGHWLIHGHTHQHHRVDKTLRQLHVGIDAWDYRPISEDQIIAEMSAA